MIKDFSYHILNMESAFFPSENDTRNELFTAWNELWQKVYEASNSGYKLSSDEFVRQNLVTAIMYKDQVAAVHLYSFSNLENKADRNSKYFEFFSESFIHSLKMRNVKTVMSMEFLTVMPEFRKSRVGFSLGSVLIQLGSRISNDLGIDATLAVARNDVGVNALCEDLGFSYIEKETQQRGFVCDLMACFSGENTLSKNEDVNKCADEIWSRRKIYDSVTSLFAENKKKNDNLKVA